MQVSKLFADASSICLTAFISPYRADRDVARKLHEEGGIAFIEVFIDAPLHVVEQRDPKGLYKRARAGEIKGACSAPSVAGTWRGLMHLSDFTGISAPYEPPETPEIHIKTDECDVEEAVRRITDYLSKHEII